MNTNLGVNQPSEKRFRHYNRFFEGEGIDEINVKEFERKHLHIPATLGEHLADVVATGMGSWRFIILQTTVVILWMTFNTVAWFAHWDVYPFILLNLLFSTQAAYASPIILMSANRAASIDRKRDNHEAAEVTAMVEMNDLQLKTLDAQRDMLNTVHDINQKQLEILTLLHELLFRSK